MNFLNRMQPVVLTVFLYDGAGVKIKGNYGFFLLQQYLPGPVWLVEGFYLLYRCAWIGSRYGIRNLFNRYKRGIGGRRNKALLFLWVMLRISFSNTNRHPVMLTINTTIPLDNPSHTCSFPEIFLPGAGPFFVLLFI